MAEFNGTTWDECRKHVLYELDRLNKKAEENHALLVDMRTDMAKIDTSIAVLKLKYAILGGAVGATPGILALVLWALQ